jgi:hypothetical protein
MVQLAAEQARYGRAGYVADVVQPPSGFQEIGVRFEDRRQAACPRGDALDVRPATGNGILEERVGEMFRPGSQRGHAAKARRPERDVHGPEPRLPALIHGLPAPTRERPQIANPAPLPGHQHARHREILAHQDHLPGSDQLTALFAESGQRPCLLCLNY